MTNKEQIKTLEEEIEYYKVNCKVNHKRINQLNDLIFKIKTEPKMKAMIGRCFKYRNNYSATCPGWWLYTKVIGRKNKTLTVCRFQITSIGNIEINIIDEVINIDPLKHHLFQISITKKQFNANLNTTIKKLESMRRA